MGGGGGGGRVAGVGGRVEGREGGAEVWAAMCGFWRAGMMELA